MTTMRVGEDTGMFDGGASAPRPGPKARHTDVSRLLGIGHSGVWIIAALFVVIQGTFAFTNFDAVKTPWPSIVAVAVLAGATVLLGLAHSDPFPALWTAGVIIAIIATTSLVSFQLAPSGDIGKEAWHTGANGWLLFFLAMRGRIAWSWVGFVAMAAVHVTWGASVERGPIGAALMLQTQAGLLLVATLFTVALRNTSRHINELNLRSVESAAAAASSDAEHDIRRARVEELAELATPLLHRIATTRVTYADDRIDYLLAEATLRDSVRARSLHLPEIVTATAAARTRGVEVTLLDDRGQPLPTEDAMRLVTARITESLRNVDSGRLTIRMSPPGRAIAVSIVVESHGETRRMDLDEAGALIVQQ